MPVFDLVKKIWGLRTAESRSTRATWWLGMAALLGLVIFWTHAATYVLTLWCGYNLILGISSFFWMLFHPRSLGKSTNAALSWSRWITIVAATVLYINLQTGTNQTTILPSVVFVIVLASLPFLYVGAVMFSLFGASIGAFARRAHDDTEDVSVATAAGWWLSVVVIVVFTNAAERSGLRDRYSEALMLGAPTFTLLIARVVNRVFKGEVRAPARIVSSALRRLVFYRVRNGKTRTYDLRGIAIGLLAAILTLSFGRTITAPAQQSMLASLFKLPTQFIGTMNIDVTPEAEVVLVKMDATAQATAVTTTSEAAVQAALVRRLKHANVGAILLPAPTIDIKSVVAGDTNARAVRQTIRDIPDLAAAIKDNGRVIVVMTQEQRRQFVLKPLADAAQSVGQFGEERYGPSQLPTIPLKWTGDPPSPLLALSLRNNRVLLVTPVQDDPGLVRVSGEYVPQAIPNHALLDFRMIRYLIRKETIPTYPYETLLNQETLPVSSGSSETKNISADLYLAHKVVVMEPLVQSDVDTPIGVMPQYEVLARITSSLINDCAMRLGSPYASVFWTVLLALLIGASCVGMDPLQAIWRVALLMLFNFGYSILAYLFFDTWADPVLPLVTAVISFLLVTQLTFALERDERERNRQLFSRFIAREFVDELLQSPTMKLALGGEKRTVCVLFADVRNFTGFAESHRPEEVIEIMNLYLTALTDALDLYGGLLDKYTGDGLMAFFEIKGDVQVELIRSVNAALAMRESAIGVSDRLREAGRKTLDIGIGMHYGEAVVGLVGNEKRQVNYTALGHTVVVSARLQTLAEGGEVVISEAIYDQVKEHFIFIPIPSVFVKGISIELHPFQVTRLNTAEANLAPAQVTKERPL